MKNFIKLFTLLTILVGSVNVFAQNTTPDLCFDTPTTSLPIKLVNGSFDATATQAIWNRLPSTLQKDYADVIEAFATAKESSDKKFLVIQTKENKVIACSYDSNNSITRSDLKALINEDLTDNQQIFQDWYLDKGFENKFVLFEGSSTPIVTGIVLYPKFVTIPTLTFVTDSTTDYIDADTFEVVVESSKVEPEHAYIVYPQENGKCEEDILALSKNQKVTHFKSGEKVTLKTEDYLGKKVCAGVFYLGRDQRKLDVETSKKEVENTPAQPVIKTFTVTFLSEDKEVLPVEKVEEGKYITTIPTNPEKTDHIFEGWTVDGSLVDPVKYETTKDTVFVAQFKEKPKTQNFIVTFLSDDKEIGKENVEEGKSIATIPANPEKTGFVFDGWIIKASTDNKKYTTEEVKNYSITSDVTFVAVFKAEDKQNTGNNGTSNSTVTTGGGAGGYVVSTPSVTTTTNTNTNTQVKGDEVVREKTALFPNFAKKCDGELKNLTDPRLIAYYDDLNVINRTNLNRNITRAEFLKLVINSANIDLSNEVVTTAYSDVTADHTLAKYISYATRTGLVSGDNGKFRPNDTISRAEAAKIFVNSAGLTLSINVTTFADVDTNNSLARHIQTAYDNCLLHGRGTLDGNPINPPRIYEPNSPITLAETAKVLYNIVHQ